MLKFHFGQQLVGHAVDDNQHFFIGTDDVVIKRSTVHDSACRTRNIGRFVYDDRWITRARGDQTFVGMFARRLHHGFAAGHHQQTDARVFKQALRGVNVWIGDGYHQVGWAACGHHSFI